MPDTPKPCAPPVKHPTIWAHIEGGELVNADERIGDLCCSPAEAVRYEALVGPPVVETSRIADLESQLTDWLLIKNEPVVIGRLAVIKMARGEATANEPPDPSPRDAFLLALDCVERLAKPPPGARQSSPRDYARAIETLREEMGGGAIIETCASAKAEQAPRPWDEGGRDDYYSKLPGDARLVAGLNPLTEGATALRNRIQSARERLASDDLLGLNIALNDILGTYATAERVPTPTDETATLRAELAKCEAEKAAVWQGHAELFARCTQLTLELAKARGWDGEQAPGQPSAEELILTLKQALPMTMRNESPSAARTALAIIERRLGVKP